MQGGAQTVDQGADEVNWQVTCRHVVHGEEHVVAPAAKIGVGGDPLRRLVVLDGIGPAQARHPTRRKHPQRQVALLAHVEEMFPVSTHREKHLTC